MKTITGPEYEYARGNYMGWCEECQDWTNDMVEPDARDYICEVCGSPTVIGAEDAMLMEKFYISDEEET